MVVKSLISMAIESTSLYIITLLCDEAIMAIM